MRHWSFFEKKRGVKKEFSYMFTSTSVQYPSEEVI